MSHLLSPFFERRTYLETVDLVLDLIVGITWFSVFTTLVSTGASLAFTLVGLPILTGTLYLARLVSGLERRRARCFLGTDIDEPVREPAHGDGVLQRLLTPFRDRTTWRELVYTWLVQPTQAVVTFSVAVTAWFLPLYALTLPIYARYSPPELWNGQRLNSWPEIIPIAVGGLILLVFAPWIIRGVARADRAIARWGLSPRLLAPPAAEPATIREMKAAS